jgi:hypothetical protein
MAILRDFEKLLPEALVQMPAGLAIMDRCQV